MVNYAESFMGRTFDGIAYQMLLMMLPMESSVLPVTVTVTSLTVHHSLTMYDHRLKHYYLQPTNKQIEFIGHPIANWLNVVLCYLSKMMMKITRCSTLCRQSIICILPWHSWVHDSFSLFAIDKYAPL